MKMILAALLTAFSFSAVAEPMKIYCKNGGSLFDISDNPWGLDVCREPIMRGDACFTGKYTSRINVVHGDESITIVANPVTQRCTKEFFQYIED